MGRLGFAADRGQLSVSTLTIGLPFRWLAIPELLVLFLVLGLF